jgi:hypothetical protein
MVVQIVRFKSGLTYEQLMKVADERLPQFQALKGLEQKYYLKYDGTDDDGAVYLWASEAALNEYRQSELFRTIPSAYQVQGPPDIQTAELVMTLRPGA